MIQEIYSQLAPEKRRWVEQVIGTYQKAGHQCYLVGGSVRDLGLGLLPQDFDFATNAPLEASFKLFPKVIPTGVAHGTVTLLLGGMTFEVTRYRLDVQTDGRHAEVRFAQTLEEDLGRRDLRINAIAFEPLTGQVIDPEGGLKDLAERMIRFVGPAAERIREDHLRALRYLRMIAKLAPYGFGYEPDELAAVLQSFDPKVLSLERIYDELGKMKALPQLDPHFLVQQLSALQIFAPRLSPQSHPLAIELLLTFGDRTALGALVSWERGANRAEEDLRLTRREKRLIQLLLTRWGEPLESDLDLKAFLSPCQPEDREELAQLAQRLWGARGIDRVKLWEKALVPLQVSDLKISANGLAELGFHGKALGEIQKFLLTQVWADPSQNQPEKLVRLALNQREENLLK
ncbi:MAG: hypothetical protein A2600_06395 [Candidatus Lambdaproteobacteria bacterium RIFOXYD1_FULL_56_27]|uniref:Poly A polymerase head domain-containing protein n=1 Tax=Candidatus Lambdaproteobacteria bacterium RIFOXYD2_FULL_56_26 TaxID=1817773 RepID=A0A1F6H0A0_9PROT|nr:MAG: hypothetical protein A2426_05810 [Candidatus Lambdaproteobacteria bacterium RIFOXYC1_FULL_56_13]OGH03837.1 MAG: hypothetical protein A2557_11905 [Candidatus Lambdaproteobacteria bacterium RIFOXYD2_FULL_56_26]OGH08965.1 MAG: hypothetical protein A2600_06395 [Candidatus Lambdaproteobacteria bacterium RIFOXYD1_FULL_56_27]